MKMQLVKYNLDTREEPKKYRAIKETAQALGHKLMDASSPGTRHDWLDNLPDEVTINPAHLFADQYNTIEGFRVHDWYEEIFWTNRGQRTSQKKGYYLTGEIEQLRQAKGNRYACNYCGKQYQKAEAPTFCSRCVGFEYLTEDRLPMLIVRPIMEKWNGLDKAPADLVDLWRRIEPELKAQYEAANLVNLQKKAEHVLANARKKAAELMEEANMLSQLLTHGIDTDNLIYYSHTKRWCFGWHKPLSKKQIQETEARLRAVPCGEFLLSNVDFKQQGVK